MSKFRKRPVIVEAEQFLHGATAPRGVRTREDGSCYVVGQYEAQVPVFPGDWIFVEPDGIHAQICHPDVFAATYEPFEEQHPKCTCYGGWQYRVYFPHVPGCPLKEREG